MQGQREIWEATYELEWPQAAASGPSDFAREAAGLLRRRSRVLELGCGAGVDAAYLAGQGHAVVALDFAEPALRRNRRHWAGVSGLHFVCGDIAAPLPFADGAFGMVYARLSLHYFPDAVTRRCFAEIERVIVESGLLAFMCKSTQDPLYGRGSALEPDMFELDHVRHFFSEAYARDCLGGRFAIEQLRSRGDGRSAFVEVIARKRG